MNQQTYKNYYYEKCEKDNTTYNKNFADWMDRIEKQIYEQLEILLLDLSDEAYMDMFDNNYSVDEVVSIIIESSNIF